MPNWTLKTNNADAREEVDIGAYLNGQPREEVGRSVGAKRVPREEVGLAL